MFDCFMLEHRSIAGCIAQVTHLSGDAALTVYPACFQSFSRWNSKHAERLRMPLRLIDSVGSILSQVP